MYVLLLIGCGVAFAICCFPVTALGARWQNYTISDKDAETLQRKLEEK